MVCHQCNVCCKLFLINLSKNEYLSGIYKTVFENSFKDFTEAEKYGANLLKQKQDGSCVYLSKEGCSIHKDRPLVCRDFFCDSEKEEFQGMIKEINFKKDKKN